MRRELPRDVRRLPLRRPEDVERHPRDVRKVRDHAALFLFPEALGKVTDERNKRFDLRPDLVKQRNERLRRNVVSCDSLYLVYNILPVLFQRLKRRVAGRFSELLCVHRAEVHPLDHERDLAVFGKVRGCFQHTFFVFEHRDEKRDARVCGLGDLPEARGVVQKLCPDVIEVPSAPDGSRELFFRFRAVVFKNGPVPAFRLHHAFRDPEDPEHELFYVIVRLSARERLRKAHEVRVVFRIALL